MENIMEVKVEMLKCKMTKLKMELSNHCIFNNNIAILQNLLIPVLISAKKIHSLPLEPKYDILPHRNKRGC